MKQLPNIFTLLNLVFGCLAVIFILQSGIGIMYSADGAQLVDLPQQIWLASLFMALAGLVDFFDGFVARLFGSSSAMGKELDSLADLVSFGVAPGLIMYQFLKLSLMREENGLDLSMFWLLPALLIPCAAAYRLARFNLDQSQSFGFKGIPAPAAGLLIASFPLIYWTTHQGMLVNLLLNKWFLYAVIILVSLGMVSRLPLFAFKFKSYGLANNRPQYLLLVIAIVAVLLLKWLAVPVIFLFYIVLSLLFKNKTT